MPRFGSFFIGVLVGGALVFFAQRYHVVRTNDGVELVPKLSSGFSETYVNIRDFESSDWANHKALAAAIMHAKKDHLITDVSAEHVRQGVGRLVDELKSLGSG